jgi:hypothetical protein
MFALALALLGPAAPRASFQEAATPPAASAPGDAKARRLKEDAELRSRAEKEKAEHKLDEAAATAGRALALERELFGEAAPQVAEPLTLLAGIHERREDWDAATKAREEALAIVLKQSGAGHWRAADARRGVEYTATLRRLNPLQRKALRGADDEADVVAQLHKQGK